MVAAAPRLQLMYDAIIIKVPYTVTIKHKCGRDIPVADTLSKHIIDEPVENPDDFLEVHVHGVICPSYQCPIKNVQSTETEKDPQLKQLKSALLRRWLNLRKDCPRAVLDF